MDRKKAMIGEVSDTCWDGRRDPDCWTVAAALRFGRPIGNLSLLAEILRDRLKGL
jgi:hypothetical protein